MCYDDNARPPVDANEGAAQGEDLVLTAEDGTRFAAYAAHPAHPTGASIVIYPDVRGLHTFYKELALRFAEAGIRAIALDYFGRTAVLTSRDDSFEFMPHVQQLTLPTFYQDVAAAKAYLQRAGGPAPTFVVGFCMGGSLALVSATHSFDWAGVIAFYAGMSRNFAGAGTLLDLASGVRSPVLGLFGGADPGIPPEQVAALDVKLDEAGVPHEIISYPGAPHSFFDRKQAEYAEQSADAWQRILAFITERS